MDFDILQKISKIYQKLRNLDRKLEKINRLGNYLKLRNVKSNVT